MHRPGSTRNVLVSVLLSLSVLTACSTLLTACSAQGPRHTPEQRESARTPPHSESTTQDTLETAGAATAMILVLGIGLAVAALPVLLVVFLL